MTKTRDVAQKQPKIALNEDKLESKVTEKTINLRKDGNSDEIVESARLSVLRNKASKIPRMKPNFFSPADNESRIHSV